MIHPPGAYQPLEKGDAEPASDPVKRPETGASSGAAQAPTDGVGESISCSANCLNRKAPGDSRGFSAAVYPKNLRNTPFLPASRFSSISFSPLAATGSFGLIFNAF
jgi:hypothetical protein